MDWIFWALISSIMAAAGIEMNRALKKDGATLNFLKQLFMVGLAAPFLPFLQWPDHELFIAAASAAAVAITIGQTVGFNLAARQQSRVASMVGPVQMASAFLLWISVDAVFRADLMEHWIRLPFIAAAFALIAYAVTMIRRNDSSWSAFVFVAPVGVMFALTDILGKRVLIGLPPADLILSYIFMCGVFSIPMLAVFLSVRKIPAQMVFSGSMTGAGMLTAVLGMGQVAAFLMALMTVPNPAYLTAFMVMVPLWIFLWHKLRGIEEKSSPHAMLLMAAGALLLIASQQLG